MVRGRVLSVVYYCWSRSGHWPATVKTPSRTSSSAVSVECPFLYSCMQIGTGWSWRSWAGRAECVPARVSRGPWTWLAGWRSACSSLVNFHVWGISSCQSYNSKNIVDMCSADIPLHIGIRQTSDEGSPIVISQPDSVEVSLPSVIQTSLFFHRPTML